MSNEAAASLAALNVGLLEAIKTGGHEGRQALAEAAGIVVNNLNRKLDALAEAGLIRSIGEATYAVELTADGERALAAMAVWRGEAPAPQPAADGEVYIPFSRIKRWPDNPRTVFDPADDEAMAQSIADKNILQAISVRAAGDDFQVMIGERRRRGAALGVERGWIAADFLVRCKIVNWSDEEAYEVAGVENLQREDMHWMDEAKWYARLAERLSGSQIERLVGGQRKKRSIQDYIKCARELSADDLARCYLADGHKDQLTYVKARDLVGEKKQKPPLDLSARTACALLELIACGLKQRGMNGQWAPGETIITRFAKPPVGGPLGQLGERKLIVFGFLDGKPIARTVLSEEIVAWLTHPQIDFKADPLGALYRVRAPLVGEMQARILRDGEWVTDELNAPAAPPAAAPEPASQAPPHEDAARGLDLSYEHEDDARDGGERAPEPQGSGGEAAEAGPQSTPPPPSAEPAELPPMLAIVLVEAAHRISREGVERGPGTWAAPVLANYYLDKRGQQLVHDRKAAFLPNGDRMMFTVTKGGLEWLADNMWGGSTEGRPYITDETLRAAQLKFMGHAPEKGPYHTQWLNPPAEAPAQTTVTVAMPGGAEVDVPLANIVNPEAAGLPRRDAFAESIVRQHRETQAFFQAAGALRQVRTFLESLIGKPKPPKADEIGQYLAIIGVALEAAQPHLEDETPVSDA